MSEVKERARRRGTEPAFPIDVPEAPAPEYGLMKREYFAAMAMQGFLANPAFQQAVNVIPGWAVNIADDLLEKLEGIRDDKVSDE